MDFSHPLSPHTIDNLPMNKALTFGVELEFLIAAIPLEYPDDVLSANYKHRNRPTDPFPNSPLNVSILTYPSPGFKYDKSNINSIGSRMDTEYASYSTCIADSLKRIGVRASPFYHFPPYVTDAVAMSTVVRTTWEVKRDSSVYRREEDGDPLDFFTWRSVELASPVFYNVEAAYEEIRKVCQHLTTTYQVMVNSTCGLHIHVGNGSRGFDLNTIQNLMTSLWTWEPQIHILHPASRTSDLSSFCKSLRGNGAHPRHQPKGAEFKDPERPTNWEAVAQIWRCKSIEELVYWLANPDGFNAYKMENLLPVVRRNVQTEEEAAEQLTTSKRTIEFRQHEGTLDPDRVINWAKLCIGFVDRARIIDPDVSLQTILDQLDNEDAHPQDAWADGLSGMLNDVAGTEVANFYTNWLAKNKPWVEEQLDKRKQLYEKDNPPQPEPTETEIERNYRAAVRDIERLDREWAAMETPQKADQDRRAGRPVEKPIAKPIVKVRKVPERTEGTERTPGRRRAPQPCTATTNLKDGPASSKMKLLDRAAGDRFCGI